MKFRVNYVLFDSIILSRNKRTIMMTDEDLVITIFNTVYYCSYKIENGSL